MLKLKEINQRLDSEAVAKKLKKERKKKEKLQIRKKLPQRWGGDKTLFCLSLL